jgi:hypothetical protein
MKWLQKRFLLFSFIVLFTVLASLVSGASQLEAAPTINVQSGAILITNISAGQTYVHTMVINNPSDKPLDLQIVAGGLGQTTDGSNIAVPPDEDTSPYSALDYINQIDKQTLHLEPGSTETVKATIQVPQNCSPGTRYAMIHISSAPSGDGRVGVIVGVDVPIVLTVPGSNAQLTGEITGLEVPEAKAGQSLIIHTTFKNTGNYHFKAKNRITVTDSTGQTVGEAETALAASSIIPTFSRLFKVTPSLNEPLQGLPLGTYNVDSKVLLEDGTVLDSKQTSFQISEAPPSTGSIAGISESTISPISPADKGSIVAGISWPLAAGIVGGILVIGILMVLLLTRKPGKKE